MKKRMADMLKQADAMQDSIDTMQRMYDITAKMAAADAPHGRPHARNAGRDSHIAGSISRISIDFLRPIRSYFYWEKHCFDIPICWSLRSIFESLDGLDQIVEKFTYLTATSPSWTPYCRRCSRRCRR